MAGYGKDKKSKFGAFRDAFTGETADQSKKRRDKVKKGGNRFLDLFKREPKKKSR